MKFLKNYWNVVNNPQSVPLWMETLIFALNMTLFCFAVACYRSLHGEEIDLVSFVPVTIGATFGANRSSRRRRKLKEELIAGLYSKPETTREPEQIPVYQPSSVMIEGTMTIQSEPPPVIPGTSFNS